MDLATLYEIVTISVLPFWLLLFVAPHWKPTQIIVHSVIAPLWLGAAYAFLIATGALGVEGGSFGSLDGLIILFSDPRAVLAGWTHYLVFDLFVGAWQVRDAKRHGISHWFVIPCLFFTLMAGPIGLLMYFVLRLALGKGDLSTIETEPARPSEEL